MDIFIKYGGERTVFSTIDTSREYSQAEIDKNDEYITAFRSSHGQCRFARILFEPGSVPTTFRRALDVLIALVELHTALQYL